MNQPDPAVFQRRLLVALRERRRETGLTQDQVAERLGWSPSKVLRIENGKNNISREDLAAVLALYGVTSDDDVRHMLDLAREASKPSWPQFKDAVSAEFRTYLGLESAATVINEYEPMLIPGLLQTPEYAQLIIAALSPEERLDQEIVDRRARIRAERQRLVGAAGPKMTFLIGEAAVRRQVGGRQVMLAQFLRLRELAALPNITVQIVPFSVGEHASMTSPFIVLEFGEDDIPLLYLEDSRHDLLAREDHPLTARYQAAFATIAALATPAVRFDRIVGDLIANLDHSGAGQYATVG